MKKDNNTISNIKNLIYKKFCLKACELRYIAIAQHMASAQYFLDFSEMGGLGRTPG